MGHKGMTTSQDRSMGRHLVSLLLRGQNGGSTTTFFQQNQSTCCH